MVTFAHSDSPAGHIRRARPGEAASLAALYAETVRQLGPALYTPEQVAAWAGFGEQVDTFEALLRSTADTFVWDAAGTVQGFCTIEPSGYVNLLYVAPDATRRGIGGRLLQHAMQHAQQTHQATRFTAKASHFSKALFERHGFEVESEEYVEYGSTNFHRYAMSREVVP